MGPELPAPPRMLGEALDLWLTNPTVITPGTITYDEMVTFIATIRDGCPPRPDARPTEEPEQEVGRG